jgi:hypothetical protein
VPMGQLAIGQEVPVDGERNGLTQPGPNGWGSCATRHLCSNTVVLVISRNWALVAHYCLVCADPCHASPLINSVTSTVLGASPTNDSTGLN